MFEILYHECNPFITTVEDGSTFKNFREKLERKTLEEDIIFARVFQ